MGLKIVWELEGKVNLFDWLKKKLFGKQEVFTDVRCYGCKKRLTEDELAWNDFQQLKVPPLSELRVGRK